MTMADENTALPEKQAETLNALILISFRGSKGNKIEVTVRDGR